MDESSRAVSVPEALPVLKHCAPIHAARKQAKCEIMRHVDLLRVVALEYSERGWEDACIDSQNAGFPVIQCKAQSKTESLEGV